MNAKRASGGHGPTSGPTVVSVLSALARRPWLWPAALAASLRLARPGWWHRWPLLPVPDEELWRFRMETAYGGSGESVPDKEDVVSFIGWSSTMGRWRRQ